MPAADGTIKPIPAEKFVSLPVGEGFARLGSGACALKVRFSPPIEKPDPAQGDRICKLSWEAYRAPESNPSAVVHARPPASSKASSTGHTARPRRTENPLKPPNPEPQVPMPVEPVPESPVGSGGPMCAAVLLPPKTIPPSGPTTGRGGPRHKYLAHLIKKWGESHGFRATIEKAILHGAGSVDVALEDGTQSIAVEISVTTSPEHEAANLQKCLVADFHQVVLVSTQKATLKKTREVVLPSLKEEAEQERVHFMTPEDFFSFLEKLGAGSAAAEATVRGYKVKVRYQPVDEKEKEERRRAISQVILRAMKRLPGEER